MMPHRANCLMAGLVLFLTCTTVFSHPQSLNVEDQMMADDDFEYEDDQSVPVPQTKGTHPSSTGPKDIPPQQNRTVQVNGVLGEDVILKCDLTIDSDGVVLWYFGKNVVASGHSVVQTNFKLDANYDLTILKASPKDAGDYYCKVLPQESVLNVKVILTDQHSLDAIAPESSTSAAQSSWNLGHTMAMWLLLLTARLLQH